MQVQMPVVDVPDDLGAFRELLRAWLAENLPAAWASRPFPASWPPSDEEPEEVAVSLGWHRRLFEAGWIAPGWPREEGGLGLDLARRMAMTEEFALARTPVPVGFQGIDILGPALIAYGTTSQKRRFLPKILSAEELWCQGYSEPDSGSDLASMKTKARRGDRSYVVVGQKVWTSYGGRADWCFALVRTGDDRSRHRGLTMLLIEMSSPGLEWRPIRQATGESHFGELFLTDVEVPLTQRVGEEGQGWEVAMRSLAHERILSGNVAPVRARLDALKELIKETGASPTERQRVAALEARVRGAFGVQARALQLAELSDARFGAWASMVKVLSTEIRIDIARLATDVLGNRAGLVSQLPAEMAIAQRDGALWAHELVDALAGPIYAGTNQIQRNVVAEVGLGLPR